MNANAIAVPANNVAKIHVSVSGTNMDSYNNVSDISINALAAPTRALN